MTHRVVQPPLPPSAFVAPQAAQPNPATGAQALAATPDKPVRPVYRHSVVPGGVQSARDIAEVVKKDSVVAAHYAGLKVDSIRSGRLLRPTLAHVSYRIGDNVYWTSKPVKIPSGERILTDGKTTIRERCGNIIAAEPLGPALEQEPALPELDVVDGQIPLDGVPLSDPPDPIDPADVGFVPYVDAPVPVPEPGTFVLVGLGGAAVLARYVRSRRARRKV
jgi:hypothetical protein